MKRGLSLILLTLFTFLGYTQIEDPVKWTYDKKELGNNEYSLLFKAKIDKGWHLYSQFLPSDDGPIATSFTFEKNDNYKLIGKVTEPEPHHEYDPNFDMELTYFENEVVFTQKIKVLKEGKVTIKGEQEFMVCDATKCLPPDYPLFSFEVTGKAEKKEVVVNLPEPKVEKAEPIQEEIQKPEENQLFDPVKWSYDVYSLGNDEYNLVFKATIEEHWHLYSQNNPDDGPVPTSFKFDEDDDFELIGTPQESEGVKTSQDPNFGMELRYFENEARFTQRIKTKNSSKIIEGVLTFMVCDDTKCLPPAYVDFNFDLNKSVEVTKTQQTAEIKSEKKKQEVSWGDIVLAFFSGFAALLTPCVFPMIPMTVSFFTKQSKSKAEGVKNAAIYGTSIVVLFTSLGWLFGEAVYAVSTSWWMNLFFFIMILVFAISFLGAFELTLPSSWINSADKQADKGGILGIFFLALVLALVSFTCTGPIVGTLLIKLSDTGGIMPLLGMISFSTALALPFVIFSLFPGLMNSLPQSGGWLNMVKVTLGMLELALALKFLSNVDATVNGEHLILGREMFLGIHIAIFILIAMYLFGVFRMAHDSETKHISIPRFFFGLTALTFALYMLPGLWGAPLKLIAGYPPAYGEVVGGFGGGTSAADPKPNDHMKVVPGINGLYSFHTYEEALEYAKEVKKPILLDYTGYTCPNCRKMEANVWSDPNVLSILKNDIVLVSLHCDDSTELPKEEQIEVEFPGGKKKKLKNYGLKWQYMQISRYNSNSQPKYVFQDYLGNDLKMEAASYETHGEISLYKAWLDEGIKLANSK